MMKIKIIELVKKLCNAKEICIVLLQTLFITSIVVFSVIPFSCKVTSAGIEFIGGDYSAPTLDEMNVVDNQTLKIKFSENVKVTNAVISPRIVGISDSSIHSTNENLSPSLAAAVGEYGKIDCDVVYDNENHFVTFRLQEATEIGREYELFGVVEDRIGNSLTFTVPFSGYNATIPRMIMTEIQIKYGKGSSGGQPIYRGEFVEFLALEDGNLIGLELFSASDGEKKKYQFPNIEVKKGEVILVHLRTVGEGCVNEELDYNAATAPHSKDEIRDLWDENTTARFNDSSDVIILRNRVDGSIIDGIMYASADAVEWKTGVAESAVELQQYGIYQSYEIQNANISKGCTTLKSLTRQNAQEIYDTIMNDEEYEFPFPSDEDTWNVQPVSPGIL